MKIITPPELRSLIETKLILYYRNIPVKQFNPKRLENSTILRSSASQSKMRWHTLFTVDQIFRIFQLSKLITEETNLDGSSLPKDG